MAARHGTRSRYNAGCTCDPCKQAERDYQTARRQAKKAAQAGGQTKQGKVAVLRPTASTAVDHTADHSQQPEEYGPVETAIRKQLGALSTVDSREGEAEMAYALARLIDTPGARAQHTQAVHRLSELVDKLRKGADKKTGKLASVRKMTRPESATG